MLDQEACHLLQNFRSKTLDARKKQVTSFARRMWLTYHATTYNAQKNFHEMEEESKHFIKFCRSRLLGKIHVTSSTWIKPPDPLLFSFQQDS
jgi:hypothetical protein